MKQFFEPAVGFIIGIGKFVSDPIVLSANTIIRREFFWTVVSAFILAFVGGIAAYLARVLMERLIEKKQINGKAKVK